ncbi:SCO family protein [Methylocystis bryophila]|uniref:Thioredoxin domain-containing protein n=1 Tax=Methylocystis bryophila TaxID=655015 RepID=A0A1W6MWR0_9HYPH|nr:SCO family protein [Methylocystis bryophila]ARN82020.1 hypothetical protein B1812_14090 [Methylocystis bryophila]
MTRSPLLHHAYRICVLLALISAALGIVSVGPSRNAPQALFAGEFRLVSADGARVDSQSLKGRAYAVFFGYTHCPGVCPTTLAEFAALRRDLGAKADGFALYFITLDPERDTSAVLKDYVASFGPGIVGLRGLEDEVVAAADSFRVHHRRVRLDDGGYAIDHNPAVFIVDPEGRVVDMLMLGMTRGAALAKLEAVLSHSARVTTLSATAAPIPASFGFARLPWREAVP